MELRRRPRCFDSHHAPSDTHRKRPGARVPGRKRGWGTWLPWCTW